LCIYWLCNDTLEQKSRDMFEYNQSEVAQKLSLDSYNFEHALDPILRKKTGSYYTSLELTIPMVAELIDSLPKDKRKKIHTLKFLEPCVGTGNFVFAYIMLAAYELSMEQIIELIDNIYVSDINTQALDKYAASLKKLVKEEFGINLTKEYFDSHIGGGLLFDVTNDNPEYIPIEDIFGKEAINSFDIVITNPPYKNLKAESTHYESTDAKYLDKAKYEKISRTAKRLLPLSSSGTINIYKLFVEEILDKYARKDALVSLLVPSSILSDKTCERLREKIINTHHIISIKNIAENNKFIDAQQSLTAILIDKNSPVNDLRLTNICKSYSTKEESTGLHIKSLATKENGHTILTLSQRELQILQQMSSHPMVKDLPFIVNLRGELDLTANKESIVSEQTPYNLLRGRNISYYQVVPKGESHYVSKEFVAKTAKSAYITMERIACQQISNIAKERRLTFTKVEPMSVLANSCNFIAVRENEFNIDANFLLGLFNSKLMNWFFKLHSSNNHINNYEINNFPIPLNKLTIQKISKLAASIKNKDDSAILNEIDALVGELFGITEESTLLMKTTQDTQKASSIEKSAYKDIRYLIPQIQLNDIRDIISGIESTESLLLKYAPSLSKFDKKVVEGLLDKYKKISTGTILNHTTFKLSDLDMEMIRPIPQGGNWKNIPEETVNKSRRLVRITETGGRTTLYGRLHYQRPSYTITTYFNRPGNGTYVHPVHDRVLSVREAARLQAFPDDYYFYGNKTQLLKQIGNAVPALLAYQIGRKIVNKLGEVKSVDLFSGAGGLTSGFKSAGIKTVLCTDFNEAACVTIKVNNPEAKVIHGDITEASVKDAVIQSALNSDIDIVCGGPPCQGFSMAGYRNAEDPRNQLFKEFVAVVEKVKPKVVVFENVEGILTFERGATYKAIHELFAELGYKTEGRLLKIDKYGVPQKRKRVIIICTRNDINLNPADLYPDEITVEDDTKITVADSIYDLESIECSDDAQFNSNAQPHLSEYNKVLNGALTAESFLKKLVTNNTVQLSAEQTSLFGTN